MTHTTVLMWRAGDERDDLWVDLTTLLAEYFTVHKNPLTRFDMSHLFNFWNSMSHTPACVLIAYVDNVPAGMVMVETMNPRSTRPYGHEISRLYVKPQFRGLGIGKLLMTKAFLRLQMSNQTKAFLLVDETNVAAATMYRQMGFMDAPITDERKTKGVLYLEAPIEDLLAPPLAPSAPSLWSVLAKHIRELVNTLFANPRTEVVNYNQQG